MKNFLLLIFLFLSLATFAKKVDEKDALKVFAKVLKKENKGSIKLKKLTPLGFNSDTLLYVAELKDEGFIIISADFVAPPVLGTCFEGRFIVDSLPGGLNYLINKYQKEIDYLRNNNFDATEKVKNKWKEYLNDTDDLKSATNIHTVSQLLSTTWSQGKIDNTQSSEYNRDCPTGCYAGCTAVAMAQILRCWRDKVAQTGGCYYDGQSAYFGGEQYCWDYMSNSSADDDNSKLIYHAGISCETDYCIVGGGGQSFAWIESALDGFVTFWGMDESADKRWRMYHLQTWEQDLKDELDNSRPVLYCGGNVGVNYHTWVIDGYNSNDEFHCNWGWGGNWNGPYSLGNFNPGSSNFNELEHAIFSLYPGVEIMSGINGPDQLTSTPQEYKINNFFDCKTAAFSHSSNITGYYGGGEWISIYANSSGTGWLQATITVGGVTYTTPRKYITCNP